jgi:hypothetical protein
VDDDNSILHHTVTRTEKPKGRPGERGIIWTARHLSRNIGPRAPGSQAERSTARFIAKELKELGYSSERQRFKTPATTAWSEFLVHMILVIGVLIFPISSHLSFALILIGFILFLSEEYGRSPFAWLQRHGQSENIVTMIRARRDPRKVVVVAAHTDSPRSAFYYHPSFVKMFRFTFILDFACQAALFMLFTFIYGGYLLNMDQETLTFLWYIGLGLLVVPSLAMIALFAKAAVGKPIPGGNDNASGVAVLLELARLYSRRQPSNIEIWLVFTGAADVLGHGIRRLMRDNRAQLKGAYYIILDQLGRGFPVCYRREGRLIGFHANRRLASVAREISKAQAHYHAGFRRNGLYLSESFQLLSRGKKAITLSSRENSRYPRYWRWRKDGYENIDPRSLRLALDFLRGMIDRLDRGDLKR